MSTQAKVYVKHHSFKDFVSNLKTDIEAQHNRVLKLLKANTDPAHQEVLNAALADLSTEAPVSGFKITQHIADELSKLDDANVCRYMFHRFRYDVFPKQKKLDQFPPYLQIEPTSVCNYRCVFCYQTDNEFTNKANGHMGAMTFETFKEIIDQVEGKVEFFSLASRGEPLLCKEIDRMLEYCNGKFVGMKMNTNASMLTEQHCHAILSGGINTLVFSADAATEPLYSQLRVKGNLEKVLKNIKMFQTIKNQHYRSSKIITRVSGVRYGEDQDMESMVKLWGNLVDQISFVAYNPWENVYDAPVNQVTAPCSDLWRRMFVWFDGSVNPCDTDFKSHLLVGTVKEHSVSDLWRGKKYEELRKTHAEGKRSCASPCKSCVVV